MWEGLVELPLESLCSRQHSDCSECTNCEEDLHVSFAEAIKQRENVLLKVVKMLQLSSFYRESWREQDLAGFFLRMRNLN